MKVNLSEVKAGYTAIKKLASKEYEKGEFDDSLHLIDQASVIASQIMWRYDDRELDLLHTKIAEKVIKNQVSEFKPQKNKIVFLDYFGSTFILAIQYIKALSKLNYDILYIYENQERGLNVPVIDIMNKYPNVTVKTIPFNISKSKSINEIYDSIVAYNPEKLFLHINTLSNVLPVIHVLPKSITKYYINLGDHAYWLGSSSIDYSFEFRSFGAVVSKEKRGISNEKILHLPYYPIINGFEFQGFPEKVENKVKIFSGGDFYKMVDSKNSYWDLVKKLLDENEDAVIIFANKIINKQGQKFLDKFIKENKFENRFFPVGFRKDINEVFRHSDIFMGSFPMSGGLMSQYAAFNSKPILQYYPKELFAFEETESVICFNDNIQISFTDKDLFLKEAKKLISDSNYRKIQGQKIKSCLISDDQFNELFYKSLLENKNQVEIKEVVVNYNKLSKWWVEVNNKGFSDVGTFICRILGHKSIFTVPRLYFEYLLIKCLKKIK